MKLLTFLTPVLILLSLPPSSSYAVPVKKYPSTLLDVAYLGKVTAEQSKLAMQKLPPLNKLEMKYSLDVYKIHYKTNAPDGTETQASGLIAMPIAPKGKVGVVSYAHGTRVLRTDVPSKNDERNAIYLAVFGSSGGYMVVMPDYLGLGDNALPVHPYVQANTLASSSIDMLLAAKEVAEKADYPLSDKLFLAGYSEGGFTTNVTYEALLKNYPELPVTASAPGSAPYDWKECMRFVILQPGPRATTYLAYFFYSMQTYYHYWSGMSELFKAPYDNLIPVLYDGKHTNQEILAALPQDPRDIFNPDFLKDLLNGNEKHAQELESNFNHYHFTATTPMLMVGTKGDHDVPYRGAEIAYEELRTKSDKVSLQSVSDTLDHIAAFPLVTKAQLEFFKQYDH